MKIELSTDALRELIPEAWQGAPNKYSGERLWRAVSSHELGDFSESGVLATLMLRDDRISAVIETRVNALLGCPEELLTSDESDGRSTGRVVKNAKEWWSTVLSDSARYKIAEDVIMMGAAFGELIWKRKKKWVPVEFRRWDPTAFTWDDERQVWTCYTRNGRVDVVHGQGRWVVFEPFGRRSWMHGAVRSLANLWLMRQWTWRDLSRHSERLGQGVFKAKVPRNAADSHRNAFVASLKRIGTDGVVACPTGDTAGESYDLELVESDSKSHEAFDQFIASINVSIAVRILGQNLTTEVQGGSYAAANVQDRVRHDYLEWDATWEAHALRSGVLCPWAFANEGDPDAAPWPKRQTDPPEDRKAKAEHLGLLGDAIAKLKAAESRVDVIAILEQHDIPLLAEAPPEAKLPAPLPAAPTPPGGAAVEPAPDAAAQDPNAVPAEQTDVRLSRTEADPIASNLLHQGWVDGLVAAASGVDLMRETLDKVQSAILFAKNPDALKLSLFSLAHEAVDPAAAELIENILRLTVSAGGAAVAAEE